MAESHEGAESHSFPSVDFREVHQPILSRIRGNCFIVPVLDGDTWYAHQLFQDLVILVFHLLDIWYMQSGGNVQNSGRWVEQTENQAEPGTLKPLCVFTLLVHEMLNWCFLLLITTHQGQHCAVYRLHILRENDASDSGSWLQFSLKCPSKYLTGNKALWVKTTLCWLFSLCQVFARKYVF